MKFAATFHTMALTALLGLTSCVQQHTVGVPLVRPVIVPVGPHISPKTVASGVPTTLIFDISANPDCTPAQLPTARITQAPEHGTAEIVHSEGYPSFPITNPRHVCNSHKFPNIALRYTSAPGFVGTDIVNLSLFMSNGTEIEYSFIVTVK